MGFLPAGWPYNQMQGGGSQMGTATNPYLQQIQWLQEAEQTPYGQQKTANEESYRAFFQKQAAQEYSQKAQQMEIQARQMELSEGSQKAAQWLAREQLKLSQQAQADQRFQFAQTFGETQLQNDRNFGLSMLSQQNALRGPSSAFQWLDTMQGQKQLMPESGFLRNMVNGTYSPTYGGTTGHQTLDGQAAMQQGDLGAMETRKNNDVGLAQQIAANPYNYAGQYAHANDYQKQYLGGAIDYAGGDSGSFIDQMKRGRFANAAR